MTIKAIFFDLGNTLVTPAKTWLPGAKNLLASLHGKRILLGIISNTGSLTTRQEILQLLPPDFDLGLFEPNLVLFSSEVQLEKPRKEVFQKAVSASGASAEECLYCSEDMVETLVAQHVGMRSIRVQTAPNSDLSNLEGKIREYELLL